MSRFTYLLVITAVSFVLSVNHGATTTKPVTLDEYGPKVPENYYETLSDCLPDDPDYQE